jgi:hypothetical protein
MKGAALTNLRLQVEVPSHKPALWYHEISSGPRLGQARNLPHLVYICWNHATAFPQVRRLRRSPIYVCWLGDAKSKMASDLHVYAHFRRKSENLVCEFRRSRAPCGWSVAKKRQCESQSVQRISYAGSCSAWWCCLSAHPLTAKVCSSPASVRVMSLSSSFRLVGDQPRQPKLT